MADPVSGTTTTAKTEISFTEHPIDYIVEKAASVVDYFTTEQPPKAPTVQRPHTAALGRNNYAAAYIDCDTRIVGFSKCR